MGEVTETNSEHLVVFTPSGKRGKFKAGTPLLDAARSLGVDVDSVCGGRGICGRCQIVVSEGDFAKFGVESRAENLEPITEPEKRYDEKRGLKADRRLSCHCKLLGDIVIDVPPESQVHKQVVRKEVSSKDIEVDPIVRLYYIEVEEADMHKPSSDFVRLKQALKEQWDVENVVADLHLLTTLQKALRDGEWKVTVAVYADQDNRDNPKEIVAIWPDLQTSVYGMAVDVGSTTIAAHLTELTSGKVLASAGIMNPQIRFGEDLMSRVSYIMMNPDNWQEMTVVVREAINHLAVEVSQEAHIDIESIVDITFVANPVMHHLLLGINPIELGGAPFALAIEEALTVRATDLELRLAKGAKAYFLPCIAGHVGADTAGVILSESPESDDAMTLLVDIGTNAEIVLGNSERLAACSSPTGPALEGAQISSGQRAAPGAIERVRIDKTTLEPKFKVIGSDLWSDEAGFAEETKDLKVTGICGSGIIEAIAEMFLAEVINSDGQVEAKEHPRIVLNGRTYDYILNFADASTGAVEISITQGDVRAVQMAKAALYAGVQLLTDHLGVKDIDRIALAGAFGSHIDVKYAMILGFIPDCDLENVVGVGNAAGDGALQALLSKKARAKITTLVREVEKIETAVEPKFQEYFVDALAIPNKTIHFPKLEAKLGLPNLLERAQATSAGGEEGASSGRRSNRRGSRARNRES